MTVYNIPQYMTVQYISQYKIFPNNPKGEQPSKHAFYVHTAILQVNTTPKNRSTRLKLMESNSMALFCLLGCPR